MDSSRQRHHREHASRTPAARPGERRLRLVPRVDAAIVHQVDALEAVYAGHHAELLRSLAALEVELSDVHPARCRGAYEQISFIRVGLRCLSDAIGELDAHVSDIARDLSDDPRGHPGGAPE